MSKFSTINLIRHILSTKNTTIYRGGRKIYAKISYFSIFLSIKDRHWIPLILNPLYITGNYDTYKGSTLIIICFLFSTVELGTMILIKSEFWRFGLHFFCYCFTWIRFNDGMYAVSCVEVRSVVIVLVGMCVTDFFDFWLGE